MNPGAEGTGRAISQSELNSWFEYRDPVAGQRAKVVELRLQGKGLAEAILSGTPPGPDQTEAIRMVREAVLLASQAITLG